MCVCVCVCVTTDQSVRGLSQARGDAQDYDPSALLNSRVDTQGRPAVLAAMIALKLQHVRLLVRAGARLDIKGEMSYGGQGNAVLRSPYSFLCEYIRSLKDKARLEEVSVYHTLFTCITVNSCASTFVV